MNITDWLKNKVSNRTNSINKPIGLAYAPEYRKEADGNKPDEGESKFRLYKDKIGIDHPFDFQQIEKLCSEFGFVDAIINKYIDFVMGPGFTVESDDERAMQIINDYLKDIDFDSYGRPLLAEAFKKGNGILSMAGKETEVTQKLRVLNSNNIYVKRDKKGTIEGYTQVLD